MVVAYKKWWLQSAVSITIFGVYVPFSYVVRKTCQKLRTWCLVIKFTVTMWYTQLMTIFVIYFATLKRHWMKDHSYIFLFLSMIKIMKWLAYLFISCGDVFDSSIISLKMLQRSCIMGSICNRRKNTENLTACLPLV